MASLEELEKRIKAIEELEEIKKLHQKYIMLMDNLKYEDVLDLFTEDAEVKIRNMPVKKGRQEMSTVYIDVLAKGRGNTRYDGHMAVMPDLTIDGDSAKGTWVVYMLFCKPTIQWVQGRNDAEYRKVNGIWKISKMKFTRTLASDTSLYP
jgi:ketosteroid isomerase-like protein